MSDEGAPLLLPAPRRLDRLPGTFALSDERFIQLEAPQPQTLQSTWQHFQSSLLRELGLRWEVSASPAVPREQVGLTLSVGHDGVREPQGYELSLTPEGAHVRAATAAGAFYGVATLLQLIRQYGQALPCLRIADWPDFAVRGAMLDVSRDKVPSMHTLYEVVDQLASWKINQLQLYTEHTFAYRQHPEVWAHASPLTGQEILELDAYCRERFVELVPNQNSFGHMHRWLKHPRYAPLAETHDRFATPWGESDGPFSLCPIEPGSLELVRGLYADLLPHFSSQMFNVGCDETFDVGQGRSREACQRDGTGQVYLDFVLKIEAEVRRHGRRMQFWADGVGRHPDLVARLPRDVVALAWGYEANEPDEALCAQLAQAGLTFYVCPGTSSWCSLAGRTENALGNLLRAAELGRRYGGEGCLITDWGDRGHWQFWPVSWLGLGVGAAYAWALEANRALDVPNAIGLHAFEDPTRALGRVAHDFGNIYRCPGFMPYNGSALFWILQYPLEALPAYVEPITPAALQQTREAIEQALAPLANGRSRRADADLIRREYQLTARLMRHACDRADFVRAPQPGAAARLEQDMGAIIDEYRSLWLSRNRPGGLPDSVARLERVRLDYAR